MLRRRDLLISLTATGVLAGCGNDPTSPSANTGWPGDLPATSATWQELPVPPMVPRRRPTLTWTGSEVLVTGGEFIPATTPPPCPANADCYFPSNPVTDGAAFDPATGTWRHFDDAPAFHHEPVWTGSLLTDGWTWFDPASGARGQAPWSDLLVYAPAWWSGSEVVCVGTDGSMEPVAHTLWACNPVTGATRTSPVPSPAAGESVSTFGTDHELFVGTSKIIDAECSSGGSCGRLNAWDAVTGSWRAVDGELVASGWDGSRGVGIRWDDSGPVGVVTVDPADGSSSELPALPAALRGSPRLLVGPGRIAVSESGRTAVLDGTQWVALPELTIAPDSVPTVEWAGDRLVAWDDSGRTGRSIQLE